MKPRELELLRRIAEAPRTLHDMTPPKTLCNASMPSGSYKAREWQVRDGGDDNRRYASFGAGC
jgi:hypothetical protein